MTDEQTTQAEEPQPAGEASSADAWREVGQQFQALGESVAAAFRTAWQSEENRRHWQGMQEGLEAMVQEVGRAIQESVDSPQAQQARAEAERAAQAVRAASEQTVQDVRPHLVSALRQVNDELQRLIRRMEQATPDVSEGGAPKPPPVTEK